MSEVHEYLHRFARERAEGLARPDKGQLRFNDIVRCALAFYEDATAGVRELVAACDKDNATLYSKGAPMWQSLEENYQWMREGAHAFQAPA